MKKIDEYMETDGVIDKIQERIIGVKGMAEVVPLIEVDSSLVLAYPRFR